MTTCCTFASPRVGNKKFCLRFNRLPITSWRIVNSRDLVPKVPLWIPPFFGYRHVETAYKFSCRGTVRSSLGCWHSLRTYLHWLDPTVRLDAECVDLLGSGEEPTTDLLKFVASNLAVRFSDLAKRFADHDPRDLRALVYDAASSGLVTIRSAEGEDFIVSIAADGSKRLQSQSWRTGWARFLGTILR